MTLHFMVGSIAFDLSVTPSELATTLKLLGFVPQGASVAEQQALAAKVAGLSGQLQDTHQKLTALAHTS